MITNLPISTLSIYLLLHFHDLYSFHVLHPFPNKNVSSARSNKAHATLMIIKLKMKCAQDFRNSFLCFLV